MQHEVLLLLALKILKPLHVVGSAQGCCYQRLGFTTREDRGTVSAWKDPGFDRDVADLVELPAIRANAILSHLLPEQTLAQHFVVMLKLLGGSFVVFRQLRLEFFLDLRDFRIALDLRILLGVERIAQAIANLRLELAEVLLVELRRSDLTFRLACS